LTSSAHPVKDPKQGGLKLVPRVSSRTPLLQTVVLKPGVTFVGRTDENGVVLKSTLVSRRHAKLIFTDLGLTVHDLDSHNGVFLNGKKVRSTPVKTGDVLYFADVCVSVEPESSSSSAFDVDSAFIKSNLVQGATAGGDDPAARNLAALLRVTDGLIGNGDEAFFVEALSAAQSLTQATLAVFVKQKPDGSLYTPVVLKEGARVQEDVPLSWPVIRRCVDERATLFSRDTSAEPLVPGDLLTAGDMGALMVVPVLVGQKVKGAVYLARPFAGEGFTDREVETLTAIAHLFALRLRKPAATDATSVRPGGDTDEGVGMRTAEERSAQEQELRDLKQRLMDGEAQMIRLRDVEVKLASSMERTAKLERELAEKSVALDKGSRDQHDTEGALSILRAELDEQQANERRLADELRARDALLQEARDRVRALEAEVTTTRAEREPLEQRLGDAEREASALREQLARAEAEKSDAERVVTELQETARDLDDRAAQQSAELLAKLPQGLRGRLTARLQGTSDGAPLDDVTALVVALSGIDAWAAGADSAQLKERLDRFSTTVHAAANAHGGVLESVLGHAHLLSFPSTRDGAVLAIRCALEVLAGFPVDEHGGVHCGIHASQMVQGFFGDDAHATYAQVGEAIAIARGTCEYARQGSVWVTDRVKSLVGDEPGLLLIATGPHLIREFRTSPINLFQIAVRS